MPKKPTGQSGQIIINIKNGDATSHFEVVEFSKDKEKIEDQIARNFVEEFNKTAQDKNKFSNIKQLKENDFDFSAKFGNLNIYLELKEITGIKNGKPYSLEGEWINDYDLAESIFTLIGEQSKRYSHKENIIYLLLYNTHYKYALSLNEIFCLRYWC